MKLVHKDWNFSINFEKTKINTLVIENKKYFRNIIQKIEEELLLGEGDICVSEEETIIDFKKSVELVTDIFRLDINNKNIHTKIVNILKEIAIEEYTNVVEISNNITKYIDEIIFQSNYPIIRSENIKIEDIFKIANLKVDTTEDIMSNLLEYFKLSNELVGTRLFILTNLYKYLDEEEIRSFFYTCSINNICILNIESGKGDITIKTDNNIEKIHIIDDDYCEI